MLYVPGQFLFIHIPRTAGNSICRTLVTELVHRVDLLCATDAKPNVFHRHTRAIEALPFIPDFHQITKFAVCRPYKDIVLSDYRILPIRDESLDAFERRRWVPWLAGLTPEQHWCGDVSGNMLDFELIPFDSLLTDGWHRICEIANIPRDTQLMSGDWQKQKYVTRQ
jgi:hypothetical protein